MPLPSLMDEEFYTLSRAHISALLRRLPLEEKAFKVLEVGPKLGWPGWDTLDIDPAARPTICADICDPALPLASGIYDLVLCVSVLEHTYAPERALANIRRILKPGGTVALQAPLNFRQHGPQPDLWRFTENGWRYMLRDWDDVQVDVLDTPERPLFPIAYAITAKANPTAVRTFTPKWIER